MRIFYQTYGKVKKKFSNFLDRFFKKKRTRIGMPARQHSPTVLPGTGPGMLSAR
jgi:hypothetical protein